jgi:hypothetical protein
MACRLSAAFQGAKINLNDSVGDPALATASELIAYLVANGCLPMVAGQQPLGPPPAGDLVPPEERARLGFRDQGFTFRYAAADSPVIADFSLQSATLRADNADADGALKALDAAIQSVAQDIHAQEEPHPSDTGRTQRVFFVRVSERRYARVTAVFPRAGLPSRAGIEVKVAGMEAIGRRAASG